MKKIKLLYSQFEKLEAKQKISAVIIVGLVLLFLLIESSKGKDFICYLDAAQKLLDKKNIYEPPFQSSRYLYHPLLATLLIPFLWLPQHLLIFIWNILNLLLFVRVVFLLQTYFELKLESRKLNTWMWILIVVCVVRFLEHNFLYGQMTVFLLWAMVEGTFLLNSKRDLPAGILVGFAAIIKMMPIILLPYLLFRKKFKAVGIALASGSIFFFVPVIVTGWNNFWEIIQYWVHTLQPNSAELRFDNQSFFPQNLSPLLFRFLTETNADYSINIFHLNYTDATVVVNIITLSLVFFTLFFLSTLPFRKAFSVKHELYELSYMLLICPLIFPHQQKYAFLLTMPAIGCLALLIFEKILKGERGVAFYFCVSVLLVNFILGTLTSDLFIGRRLSEITQHLKTITIGALLIIPALAVSKKHFVPRNK